MKKYDHTQLIAEWERMGRPEVEYLCRDGEWLLSNSVIFYDDIQYRIKSKPWIDWEHVHPSIVAMASDDFEDSAFLYKRKPLIGSISWGCGGCVADASHFTSFTQGTCDWKDSLVLRPVVIGE